MRNLFRFFDPLDKLTWFNVLVTAAVLIVLMISGGRAVMDNEVDVLALACAVFLLLMLPILYKLAAHRPKERPLHIKFPKREE